MELLLALLVGVFSGAIFQAKFDIVGKILGRFGL